MAQIVTITNPLTGQPAQVDQLDHTAQQIDDGLNIARGVSNPNLLDNWYFGNPINQRGGKIVPVGITYYSDTSLSTTAGTTSSPYTVTDVTSTYGSISVSGTTYYVAASDIVDGYILRANTAVYTFDRWKLSYHGAYIYAKNGRLNFYATAGNNELLQTIDSKPSGETIVLSAIVNDVLYCTNPVTVPTSITGGNRIIASRDIPNVGSLRIYQLASGNVACTIDTTTITSFTVKAMKLELGDQQTLAHQENGVWVLNEIPDYGEQLARCQRYFQTFATESFRPTNALDFRPVMRATPALSTITVGGKTLYTASADL